MSLVRLVEKDEVPEEVRRVFESGEEQYGQVLNTWRAIAHNPGVFQAYLPYLRAIFGPGALSQRIKDLVAVRTSLLLGCRYSVSHRVASARRQGIPDRDLVGLVDPDGHDFTPEEEAALVFAEELTTRVDDVSFGESPQGVRAETLAAVREHFSDAEIVDLALSVGLWNALARFHRVMDLELDMPPPPAELERALG